MSETHDCKASISQILAWIERGDPISAADARRVITVAETAAKIGLEPELTRLKEENERLRKERDDARDWSPEMKAAAMADAQKVCDQAATIADLLKVMEPFMKMEVALVATDRVMEQHPRDARAIVAETHVDNQFTIITRGDLRALSEAFKRAKGTI